MKVLIALWIISIALASGLTWFAAKGQCAIKETKTISKAVDDNNKDALKITEFATKENEKTKAHVKEIIKVKYIPAPDNDCPMRNVSIYLRDIYTASP